MGTVLLVLQLIVAIFLVAIILLQRSNGNALSGLGGSTSVNGLLSARGKGNILTKITAILATLFFILSLALSIYYSRVEVHATSIVDMQPVQSSNQVPVAEENNIPSVPVAEEETSVPTTTPAPAEETAPTEAPAPAEETAPNEE